MDSLIITGVESAPRLFAAHKVTHAVSFRDPSFLYPRLTDIPAERWLKCEMYDRYFEPGGPDHDGAAQIVDRLIEFGRALPKEAIVGLNCQMGISRSTAAGFILCAATKPSFEDAKRMFWRSPKEIGQHCSPNQTLLEIADDRLHLQGGMIEFGEWCARGYAEQGRYMLIPHRKGGRAPLGDPFDSK